MKSILQKIAEQNKQQQAQEMEAIKAEIENPDINDSRRSFLKNTALGGIALTGLLSMSFEDTIAKATSKVYALFLLFWLLR